MVFNVSNDTMHQHIINQQEVNRLAMYLEQGKVILYPTETIWGLGCDATQVDAIRQIDAIKQRPTGKTYILLVDGPRMLEEYVAYLPPKASKLVDYHERPLTIIYEQPINLPNSLLAPDGSIAIRVTRDPFCKALIKVLGKPIVSTSANTSGELFPTSFSAVEPRLKEAVDAIADHRQKEESHYQPSTIVKVVDGQELIFVRK